MASFTVPATDYYTDSQGGRYKYYEGAVIPLELAIALSMPGASAAASSSPFSAEQEAWLAANYGSLATMSDVSLTSPQAGDILVYNGNWENS